MRIKLPPFTLSESEEAWVRSELQTACVIQALWASGGRERSHAAFVSLIARLGWTNVGEDGRGYESTRFWRNGLLADYVGIRYSNDSPSDHKLSMALENRFPRLKRPGALVRTHTGITHYYKSLRPKTIVFIEKHAASIFEAFSIAASSMASANKVETVFRLLLDIGPVWIQGRAVSPLNSLTPALACLDPRARIPIVNAKTGRLLRVLGEKADVSGAIALSGLINDGSRPKNAFELDVYAATKDFSTLPRPEKRTLGAGTFRDLGLKSELATMAHLAARRVRYTRRHNQLTGRLSAWLKWRYTSPKEDVFDAVLFDWKPRRHILIEAKPAVQGSPGRTQIRHAIGQLFDYRHMFESQFPDGDVDLAILLPSRPSHDVLRLLGSIGIHALWFHGLKLEASEGLREFVNRTVTIA